MGSDIIIQSGRTIDNNRGEYFITNPQDIVNFSKIANYKLNELLSEKHPDLLVFPANFRQYHDDIEKSSIFSLHDNKLTTNNVMGFVGVNESQLTITSRFAKDDKSDYFLHYMLQKVFSINIFKFDQTKAKESIWDFLLYLFPYYLKKALSQGLYKNYQRFSYNDPNLKGSIDVTRHIRLNYPFSGKIAYKCREHTYDNPVTQLIRHTIEHIKQHKFGKGILSADSETNAAVNQIVNATTGYNRNERLSVMNQNIRPVSHPYFTEYKLIQKICLQILRFEKLTFGKEKDKIYGLLFDGAWLWEEYLNKIMKDGFLHPENKTKNNKHYLFETNKTKYQVIYPDFISNEKEKPKVIADAKYKQFDEVNKGDYYQIITYMYRFNSKNGYLLYPHKETKKLKHMKIIGTDGTVTKLGLAIPGSAVNFDSFKEEMKENEAVFMHELHNYSN
jgi:5-methylcytosine-specific restriction enzyme subunit McrC